MLLFLISAAVTIFLLVITVFVFLAVQDPTESRLMEISATAPAITTAPLIKTVPTTALGKVAAQVTGVFSPVRGFISGTDPNLEYQLTLAGFRKPEHLEVFTALKMLLPLLGIIIGTFFGDYIFTAVLVGAVLGFFLPSLVLSYLVTRRQEQIRLSMPDALDLLVICMEAGLGIDQALARVGDEISRTAPALAEEFQIISREQRAGKPRLDAWRSMASRVDLEAIRQFVAMLVQTERFGTPIANALGVFADTLRTRRTQAAEESAAKAGVKLLLPLVLFIFPSILVVSLGPAILSLQKMFEEIAK
jgi:tight adherence protein C